MLCFAGVFTQMTLWILVSTDGKIEQRDAPQKDVHQHLGGPITFVGAIPCLNAIVMSRRDGETFEPHAWNKLNLFFDRETVRGPIAIVCSNECGEEEDLDVNELRCYVGSVKIKVSSKEEKASE